MKKTKFIAPLLGVVGVAGTLAPLTTLTSCGNTTNKVYLATGQTVDRTVYTNVEKITYKFVQKNVSNPESTKLYLNDFQVNGVSHSSWANTFTYRTDSAGNVLLHINVGNLIQSMSTLNNISFNLGFKNKKANTNYLIGTFHITFQQRTATDQVITTDSTEISIVGGDDGIKAPTEDVATAVLKPTTTGKYMPATIEVEDATTNKTLIEGVDYTYQPYEDADNGSYAYFTVLDQKNTKYKITSKAQPASEKPYQLYHSYDEGVSYLPLAYTSEGVATWPLNTNGAYIDVRFHDVNGEKIEITAPDNYNVSYRSLSEKDFTTTSHYTDTEGGALYHYYCSDELKESSFTDDYFVVKWNVDDEETNTTKQGSVLCKASWYEDGDKKTEEGVEEEKKPGGMVVDPVIGNN